MVTTERVHRTSASTSRGRCGVFCAKAFCCFVFYDRVDRERENTTRNVYTVFKYTSVYSAMMIHFWLARWLFASHLTFNYIVIHSTSLNLKKSSGNWAEAEWRKKSFKFEFAHSAKQLMYVYTTAITVFSLTHSRQKNWISKKKLLRTSIELTSSYSFSSSSFFFFMLFTVTKNIIACCPLFKFSNNNDDDSSSYFKLSYEKRHFLINFVLDLFGSLRYGWWVLLELASCYGWIISSFYAFT